MLSPTPSEEAPSANEAVARLRLWFRDRSLQELETAGALEWDRDKNVVKEGKQFDSTWDKLPR